MRVLVCGSRTYTDAVSIETVLEGYVSTLHSMNERLTIIEGGAWGADNIAMCFAKDTGLPLDEYVADWDQHGKRAGFLRNVQMLVEGKPDVVWAFVDKPLAYSKGTAMMVKLARAERIPTYVVERFVSAT